MDDNYIDRQNEQIAHFADLLKTDYAAALDLLDDDSVWEDRLTYNQCWRLWQAHKEEVTEQDREDYLNDPAWGWGKTA